MDDFESESTVYKQAINNLTTIKLKMELVLSAGFKVKPIRILMPKSGEIICLSSQNDEIQED
jgi:hypothetical protein